MTRPAAAIAKAAAAAALVAGIAASLHLACTRACCAAAARSQQAHRKWTSSSEIEGRVFSRALSLWIKGHPLGSQFFFGLVGTGEVVLQGEEENAPRVLRVWPEAEFGVKNARMRDFGQNPAFSMAENPPNRPPGRLRRPGRLQAPPGAAESCRPPREMWQAAKVRHKVRLHTASHAPGAWDVEIWRDFPPFPM